MIFVVIFILISFILKEKLTKIWPISIIKERILKFFNDKMLNLFARIILESYLSYTLMCLI